MDKQYYQNKGCASCNTGSMYKKISETGYNNNGSSDTPPAKTSFRDVLQNKFQQFTPEPQDYSGMHRGGPVISTPTQHVNPSFGTEGGKYMNQFLNNVDPQTLQRLDICMTCTGGDWKGCGNFYKCMHSTGGDLQTCMINASPATQQCVMQYQ